MNSLHAHLENAAGGSPMYLVGADHVAGVIALGILPMGLWLLRRRGAPMLAPIDWLLVALLAASAAIHLGLAFGHDHGAGIRILFVGDAVLLGLIARRVLRGSRPGRLGVAVLVGSICAYWLSALGGEAPDQVGLATKLGEILALAIVVKPPADGRRHALRSVAGSFAIGLFVIGTASASWIGAFRASAAEPGAVAGHHVHGGSVPPPGTILPVVRIATPPSPNGPRQPSS